ncbi:MAG: energy transducer TonB [Terracidiphilus sp.]|jgi:hypothetical protein
MRTVLALSALIAAAAATAAQEPASIPTPERVQLANGTPGLIAPALRPLEITPPPDSACRGKSLTGSVRLSLVTDTQGRPRNVILNRPLSNELDYLAVQVMQNDRFQPATLNGSPVAVAGTADLHVRGCIEQSKDSLGHTSISLRLQALPQVKFELEHHTMPDAALTPAFARMDPVQPKEIRDYTPPKAIAQVMPDFRMDTQSGVCVFSAIVDEHGLPQNVRGDQCSNSDIARPATEAVRKYRFIPAMKDGMPVPVQITIEFGKKLL